MRSPWWTPLALGAVLVAGACGEPGSTDTAGAGTPGAAGIGVPASRGPRPQGTLPPGALPDLFFDFGVIPHGEGREHDFVLDSRAAIGPDHYPLGTHVDCSCASSLTLLRDAAGNEELQPRLGPDVLPREGQVVVVRLRIDTAAKEPVDVGPIESHALVQFQSRSAVDGSTRVTWPIRFRYQVDSPVRLRPYAILDFERVPRSVPRTLLTTLASDLPGTPIRFGPVHCDDDRIQFELEPHDDATWLRATLKPGPDDEGNLRALVTIDTDLANGYQVRLAAIAQLIPDLVALPIPKISLRADLRRAQPPDRAQSQYLVVTDFDPRRPAEFIVARCVDAAGNDATKDFEITFEPIDGEPRSRRMHLRWVGHAESEFRGQIVLATDPLAGPFLPIEVVALHNPQP